MAQIIAQSNMPKAQPEMEIVNNPLLNHLQIQAPPPQQGQVQPPQQPPNVAIILNPNEKVSLPHRRQVWGFEMPMVPKLFRVIHRRHEPHYHLS